MTIDEAAEVYEFGTLELNEQQAQTLQLISDGWAYPLNRFMNYLELHEVLTQRTITIDGVQEPMSIPLILDVAVEDYARLKLDKKIALKTSFGPDIVAVLDKPVWWNNEKSETIFRLFSTNQIRHPTVKAFGQN